MSYILKALRKSEAQRRLGQTPDLNDMPAIAQTGSRRGKSRRRLVLALVPLAALTIALGWLLAAPVQQWLAGGRDADQIIDSVPVEDSVETAMALEAASDPATLADGGQEQAASDVPAGPIERRSPVPDTSLVATRPVPQRAIDVPLPRGERERLVESAEEAQRLIAEASADPPAPAAAPDAASLVAPAPEPLPRLPETPREFPLAQKPAEEGSPWTPERSEFVRQWELPLAVRRDLPALSLSIHVFSADPTARFVLINGERRVEGEDLGQGARLVEIRREGALVQFRDYRFLLEP